MKNNNFKALVIEASAGTGKTTRITDEFIRVLDRKSPGVSIGRILAVTFSEKAAIEMKARILQRIYAEIYPHLSSAGKIDAENAMIRLRVSTIHSFCRMMLRRFSFYSGMDPFFSVIDERQSDLLFYRACSRFLNGLDSHDLMSGILKECKLGTLMDLLMKTRRCHPYTTLGEPLGELTRCIAGVHERVSEIFNRLKHSLSMVDFNDLEVLTARILKDSPESIAILEDFDEKNNYIFVDEFQDTNLLQWDIIYRLMEEWLSGYGAKAECGESYGIFIVGDAKQSIYKFRGAESGLFETAKKALHLYAGEELLLLENYRSSRRIIDFVNSVFSGISPWDGQKLVPGMEKDIPSRVEINFLSAGEGGKEAEYAWVIAKIFELVEKASPVRDKNTGRLRPVEFRDIAILMRKRAGNSFLQLEKSLEESGIPFVILGGIGFYREPEIIFLSSLVFAMADPSDRLSLWNLENTVFAVSRDKVHKWRECLHSDELTVVLEEALKNIRFWDLLSAQQKANAEKFLMLLQSWEGAPLYQVSRNLRTLSLSHDEPKADIFSEHQNAVRVLTVHNSKGLEFPAVFLINTEDGRIVLRDRILYNRTEDGSGYSFTLKSEAEREYADAFRDKVSEEEKRVLYVALTRAAQYLFISAVKDAKGAGKSSWISMLEKFQSGFPPETPRVAAVKTKSFQPKSDIEEYACPPYETLTSHTREKGPGPRYDYYDTVAGDVAHKLLFEIAEGRLKHDESAYAARLEFYLGKSGLDDTGDVARRLMDIYRLIKDTGDIKAILEPPAYPARAFSELPFIVEMEKGRIYEGFIDRVLVTGDVCNIYDYKLNGPSTSSHKRQLDIYEKAVSSIFNPVLVKRFIVFLCEGRVEES